jgi:hypothetical protein
MNHADPADDTSIWKADKRAVHRWLLEGKEVSICSERISRSYWRYAYLEEEEYQR